MQSLTSSYDDFEKLRLQVTTPLQLSTLPGAEMELDWGEFCGGLILFFIIRIHLVYIFFLKIIGYVNALYTVAKSHVILVH